jgi:hypothetical protein
MVAVTRKRRDRLKAHRQAKAAESRELNTFKMQYLAATKQTNSTAHKK